MLPLQPKITPAMGVAGVILIAVGLVLAFIGVRKPWYLQFLARACEPQLTKVGSIFSCAQPAWSAWVSW